ncbi:MAG: RidA family protein [Candidatus Latescibacterota bacterium]|nr:RidA family protein [Candidatus Latescibacterota bacterium]
MKAKTCQTLNNVKAILAEAGLSMDDAVGSVVYVTDLSDFSVVNKVYAEYFTVNPLDGLPSRLLLCQPARTSRLRLPQPYKADETQNGQGMKWQQ